MTDATIAASFAMVAASSSKPSGKIELKFPSLVNEMLEFAAKMVKENPVPPYNTDAYWDWRCNEAKWHLHREIESNFYMDMVFSTYLDHRVIFINR